MTNFKYQPGDVLEEVRLLPLGTPEQLWVVRTALKGESVEGQWINGPRTIIVSYDSYILRDKEGHDFCGSREHMENSSYFQLRVKYKYKVDDIIKRANGDICKIVRQVIRGEIVQGLWGSGNFLHTIKHAGYVLQDSNGKYFTAPIYYLENTSFFTPVTDKAAQQPAAPAAPAGMNAVCPHCQSPAYQGLFRLECSKNCKGE